MEGLVGVFRGGNCAVLVCLVVLRMVLREGDGGYDAYPLVGRGKRYGVYDKRGRELLDEG